MKLRQAVFAAAEMEPIRSQLFELLGTESAYVDPGVAYFGLTNVVISIGDSFLEVVVPVQDDTTAGRLLARRGASCGYMLIFQVDDFETTSKHLDDVGARRVWNHSDERVSACHIHPKDVGGAIVSFDEMRPPEDWVWGGPEWRDNRAANAVRVLGSTLQSPDPERLAARWARVLDRPASATGSGWRIELVEGTFLDFVEGAAFEGIVGFTFASEGAVGLRAKATSLGLGRDAPSIGDVVLSFV